MAQDGCRYCFFWHFFQIQGPTNEVIFLSSKPPYFTEPNSDPLTHARYPSHWFLPNAVFDNLTLDNLILGGEAPNVGI